MEKVVKYDWFTRRYQPIFDWFALPEQKSHPVLAFKLHSLLFIFSVAQILMIFFSLMGWLYISHPSIFWVPPLCLSLSWLAILTLRWTGKFLLTTHLLAMAVTSYITYFCWATDGFRLHSFIWYAFIPILAGMLGTRRAATLWAICIVVLNLTGHCLSGILAPANFIDPAMQSTWMITQQTAFLAAVGAVMYFLLVQQKISSEHLRQRIISKQNLMRILVHDIANPLSTIHLSGQLISMGDTDIPIQTMGERIQKNANRIMNIIQLIRDMEGWERGKKQLELKALSVETLLQEVINQNLNRLTSKKINLQTSFSGDEHVWGHATMLCEQVFGNLLSNAIKFSPEGGRIDLSYEATSRYEVTVVIRDYGVGIPPKLQERMFDPLAQTTRKGTAGEVGSGFGLPITKNCVEILGGRLLITSRTETEYPQDHGTRASIILRRADCPQSRRDNS